MHVAFCLSAENTDGAPAVIQPCTGNKSQNWSFEGGSIKVHGDKCLDVTGGSTQNGVKLQVWTCSDNKNPNQQFYYTVRLARCPISRSVSLTYSLSFI